MSAQPDNPTVPSLTLKRRIKASPATLFPRLDRTASDSAMVPVPMGR